MVYNNKFVAVIKVNGKVLREQNGEVVVPFGSEYSIALKNLNSVKAVAKITVDGTDALPGHEIIVPANSETELEGFMKGSKVSNKFKFIAKTKVIEKYRGNKISDGLVRVSFRFEKQVPSTILSHVSSIPWYTPFGGLDSTGDFPHTHVYGSCGSSFNSESSTCFTSNNVSVSKRLSRSVSDEGITVKGGKSDQQFVQSHVGFLEPAEHVIVLQLKGQIKTKPVLAPVTVKTKVTCETCGRVSKSFVKFCSRCGTALF